jgi:hypothetical protein
VFLKQKNILRSLLRVLTIAGKRRDCFYLALLSCLTISLIWFHPERDAIYPGSSGIYINPDYKTA